jgi:hypothetical protein
VKISLSTEGEYAVLLGKQQKTVLAPSLLSKKPNGLTAWTASVRFAVCLPKKQAKKPVEIK